MSIATRISSMEEHIKESYQELKGIGLDITGFDKNLENIPRVIDNYWETLPKVSGSGTDITLDNTKEGKMKIQLKGDTYQNTTTGANLQKYNPRTAGTVRVYSCSDNGQITLVGVDPGNTVNYAINQSGNEMSLEAGTYVLKAIGELGGVTKLTLNIGGSPTEKTLDGNQEATFTLNATSSVRTSVKAETTTTYNANFYVTLAKDTATTERYTGGIPSPNPNYPQDIEVVTGNNTITISNSDNTQSQTYPITLGSLELCKIGDYQDKIIGTPNNWKKYKAIGKVIFIGAQNENWSAGNGGGTPAHYSFFMATDIIKLNTNNELLVKSNYYKGYADPADVINTNNIGITTRKGTVGQGFYIRSDLATANASTFKTWLSTHNTTVYYVLATPVEEAITEPTLIEQLNNLYYASSYEEQTNINSRGILATDMSANALEDSSN